MGKKSHNTNVGVWYRQTNKTIAPVSKMIDWRITSQVKHFLGVFRTSSSRARPVNFQCSAVVIAVNSGYAAKQEVARPASSSRKLCELTLWPQSQVMAPRGTQAKSFVSKGVWLCCCPNTAAGPGAILHSSPRAKKDVFPSTTTKKKFSPDRWFISRRMSNDLIWQKRHKEVDVIKWRVTRSLSDFCEPDNRFIYSSCFLHPPFPSRGER